MGGSACEIPWKATVRFTAVPSRKREVEELEVQLRQVYAVPSVYEQVSEKDLGAEVCAILSKENLAVHDLGRLLEIGRSIWADY